MRDARPHARTRARAAIALTAALACALTATAQAQEDPYATVEEQAETSQLDTDLTPVAKGTDLWTLVHGAEYRQVDVVAGSVTSFDTELFSVSFRNHTIGLAGGSACEEPPPAQVKGESDSVYGARVANCEGPDGSQGDRVPALYRYSEPQDADPVWARLELPGDDRPGYIGGIDWIDSTQALIVGGSGSYPRREPSPDGKAPTDPAKADPAGQARAWIYTRASGLLEELDLASFTGHEVDRAGMRGFSAVGCFQDPRPGKFVNNGVEVADPRPDIKVCYAGGLGQLWEWRTDRFTGRRVDAASPSEDLADASLFRYRVRDIEFTQLEPPVAVAVTAGCCSATETENTPRLLVYNDDTKHPRQGPIPGNYEPGAPRWFARSFVDLLGGQAAAAAEIDNSRRSANDRPLWPDSIYSAMTRSSTSSTFTVSGILSPGGQSAERPSVITRAYDQSVVRGGPNLKPPEAEASRIAFSTARLVAGDGDVAGADPLRPSGGDPPMTSPSSGSDGVPDWAVGELRSSAEDGRKPRGLVVATALAPTLPDAVNARWGYPISFVPSGFNCPAGAVGTCRPTPDEVLNGWEPVNEEKLETHLRSQLFLLPSYSANAIQIVGAQEDGWIVGEHGAILRLSSAAAGAAAGAAEPEPPRLGTSRASNLSDRGAYSELDARLPAETGEVPEFGDETIALDEPDMVPHGPAPPGQIVMSRDGSEGWAVGGNRFFRFDGVRWNECHPDGVDGLSPPDPACAAMAGLRSWRDETGIHRDTSISLIARVPLEDDLDPTNDDELELVAIGSAYAGPEYSGKKFPAFIRYRDGRWQFEDPTAAATIPDRIGNQGFAFTAADEGWLVARDGNASNEWLYRFDGKRWSQCAPGDNPCEDPEGRVPICTDEFQGLTSVGGRVYLFGNRRVGAVNCNNNTGRDVPVILYHDRGGVWTDGSQQGGDLAGFDPGFSNPDTDRLGRVDSLSVVEGPDGYEGWAIGSFSSGASVRQLESTARVPPPEAAAMRLEPGSGSGWEEFRSPGPLEDYLLRGAVGNTERPAAGFQVTYPSGPDSAAAFVGQGTCCLGTRGQRLFSFDAARNRFELVASRRPQEGQNLNALGAEAHPYGEIQSMAPDGDSGFWASIEGHLFHYTDTAPKPVFEEAPNPFGPRGVALRDLTAGADGSVWAASDSDRVFRHDRITGWEEVRVPGWDPGRVVTRASEAEAIAIGPDGQGLVVGEQGRIASVSPERVALDPAAGRSCALGDARPCGTSRDLLAAAIAPDGSALVAGERLALLWRPPGGDFRAVSQPPIASSTRIQAVSFPTPTRAYLATDRGALFRGDMSGEGAWRWRQDNVDADGETIGGPALRDVAVDASGHGYAVGDSGTILERDESGSWHILPTPDDGIGRLTEVEPALGGGGGVLIGAEHGQIIAGSGADLHISRPPDFSGASHLTGRVVGFAYLPGTTPGSVDAWAGLSSAGESESRVLRYVSEPGDRALDPDSAASPLPDAPGHTAGELSLGAFGKSDCDKSEEWLCPEMSATTTTNEVVSERIVGELGDRRERGELDLAILSGDATDSASRPGGSLADTHRAGLGDMSVVSNPTREAGELKHRRYGEMVVDALEDRGVATFGAVGGQDLTETFACDTEGGCHTTKQFAIAGENFAWREAFAGRAEPWGDGSATLAPEEEPQITFAASTGSEDNSLAIEGQSVDADGEEGIAPEAEAEIGGASTHYAVDAIRDGDEIARIVFVDTSLRSLQASDPLQQPHELAGGQQRFLERMICREGDTTTTAIDECTRGKDQRAIVVSNTPTYSYGPGALSDTALDATTFEATMLRHDVDLVISGALGYNGLYYTLAPGVHEPCPGGQYPEAHPSGNTPNCLAGPTGPADEATKHAPVDPASLIEEQNLSGAYPTLIASGAGGKFGPDGTAAPDGPAGHWHGYSIARLLPDGDIVIEQRPILDWVGMDAPDHAIAPRGRLRLNGYGRSPVSTTTETEESRDFHYAISTAAITHRYDLLLADPDEPWLPCEEGDIGCTELHANLSGPESAETAQSANPCSPYLCLPSRIGVVDDQSGQVRAGDGKYPETFAIAMLSVDEEVATYPLVFKRSPSFVATPALRSGALPNTAGTRPTAPPSPPPPPGLPQIPQVEIPQIPPPPAIPQLTAATPPELQPPAPPAPPPPSQQPAPLDLSVAPPGVSISTPTALIQPPTPPVNPAPPGGARREARQRQAAAQKGGADSGEDASDGAGGDLAQTPDNPTAASTRYEHSFVRRPQTRPEPSFTAYRPSAGDSPVGPSVLYASGLTLLGFALATGWRHGRPTPRCRQPELPAPAWVRSGRRLP